MKQHIFFSLIGGSILWIWQFISFAAADLHHSAHAFTPEQDALLAAIEATGLPEGTYFLGQTDPALIASGERTGFEPYDGPWALLHWDRSFDQNMGMNMVRGLFVCLFVAAFLYQILRWMRLPSAGRGAMTGLLVGLMSFLAIPYTDFIWYEGPDIFAHLADAVVPWLLMGVVAGKMAAAKQGG